MTTLDETYFTKIPLKLPQSEALGTGVSSEVRTEDAAFITEGIEYYEPQFMEKVLGVDLYAEYVEGLEETIPDVKWTNLRDQIFDVANKKSPAANYVYYYVIPEIDSVLTRAGTIQPKGDEAIAVSSYHKQARAWNEMIPKLELLAKWLYDNKDIYEHDDVEICFDYNLLVKEAFGL